MKEVMTWQTLLSFVFYVELLALQFIGILKAKNQVTAVVQDVVIVHLVAKLPLPVIVI